MIQVSWSEFKSFVSSRSLSVQYVIVGDNYHLKSFDSFFSLECLIPTDPTNDDTVDFETNFKPNGNKQLPQQVLPFASKVLPNGKKLYKREHGIQQTVTTGSNTFAFIIPYSWVKITGIEILGGEHLDKCDLNVLDSASGSYSGVANYKLNQFGFDVNVAVDFYEEQCAYDADLYYGMQIQIIYNSQSAKTIGINFNLNEVK